jgi:PAB1-binding protein PBP1
MRLHGSKGYPGFNSVNWFKTKEDATKDFVALENTEIQITFQAILMQLNQMNMAQGNMGGMPGGAPGAPMMGMPPHMVRGRGAP